MMSLAGAAPQGVVRIILALLENQYLLPLRLVCKNLAMLASTPLLWSGLTQYDFHVTTQPNEKSMRLHLLLECYEEATNYFKYRISYPQAEAKARECFLK